jgi:hypothetical protein
MHRTQHSALIGAIICWKHSVFEPRKWVQPHPREATSHTTKREHNGRISSRYSEIRRPSPIRLPIVELQAARNLQESSRRGKPGFVLVACPGVECRTSSQIDACSLRWLPTIGRGRHDSRTGFRQLRSQIIDEGADANRPIARWRIGHRQHQMRRVPSRTHLDQPA